MRKLVLTLIMFSFVAGSFAQNAASKYKFKKAGHLGIQLTTHDFATAADIKSNGITNALFVNKEWTKLAKKPIGLAVTYTSGLTDHLDLATRLGGTFVSYPISGKKITGEFFLLEADVNLNVKLIPDHFFVVPYLSVGAGASSWKGYAAAYMPFGAGLQIKLTEESSINIQTQYRAPITSNNGAANLFFGFGFISNISK